MGGRGGGSGGGGGGGSIESDLAKANEIDSKLQDPYIDNKDKPKRDSELIDKIINNYDKAINLKPNSPAHKDNIDGLIANDISQRLQNNFPNKSGSQTRLYKDKTVNLASKTYDVKDKLKENGFKFNPQGATWGKSYKDKSFSEIRNDLKNIGLI